MNSVHRVIQYLHGYKVTHMLMCAAEWKLFDLLIEPATAADVAEQLALHPDGTEIILDVFAGLGFLTKEMNHYQIYPCYRELLVSNSPQSMLPLIELEKHLLLHHNSLTAMQEAWKYGKGRDRFNENAKEGVAETYGMAMDNGSQLAALHVARIFSRLDKGCVLDLGGGPGTYAETICRLNKNLRVEVYDRPEMETVCMNNISSAGLTDRVTFRVKDLRVDPLERKYEGILLSNVLHLFAPEENRNLLQRCAEALQPGGVLVVHDFFLDEGHTGSRSALLFSLDWLLIGSNFHMAGSDLERVVGELGLRVTAWKQFENIPTSILVLEKREQL